MADKIVSLLWSKGPLQRPEIMKILGLPATTAYRKLDTLRSKGQIYSTEWKPEGKVGRPHTYWFVKDEHGRPVAYHENGERVKYD